MPKIDKTVKNETIYILSFEIIFSLIMQSVFLIIGKWDITVLFGNLLSGAAAVLNFFLMGLTVQKAVQKDEKDAKNMLKVSQIYRTLLLFIIAGIGVYFSIFNTVAALLPLFFPRIAIALRPLFMKKNDNNSENVEK
ncbi:MAG: hypothetical protein J6036_00130 [Clostridia bacterium]|nr:hypothetical protein [Clostridia bacterium]